MITDKLPRLQPPVFTVNMSVPPHLRWRGSMKLLVEWYAYDLRKVWNSIFRYHNLTTFRTITDEVAWKIATVVRRRFPELSDELEGLVEEKYLGRR